MFEWKGPCSHGAHAPGHAHTSGSSSQQRPMGGRLFFCRLRHGLFLKMNSIYLRRINDSVFSVNSYITCIPLPVSTIWSIYNVFHLILFGDKWLVSEKRTDNNEVTWRPGAALQTAPSGGPRSGRGGPPRQDWELPCRQHPQGAPTYGWRGPPRQDRELGPEDGTRGLCGADDQPSGPAPACTARSVMMCETQRWFPGDRTGSQAWRRPGG